MTTRFVETATWTAVAQAVASGLRITDGDIVSVFLTDAGSFAIVEAFCSELYRRGATPHVILTDERLERQALNFASVETLAVPPAIEAESMRLADVHVSFRGMIPPAAVAPSAERSPDEEARRFAAQRRGKGIISAMRWESTRWAIVRVPTPEWAAFMGIDADQLFREFLGGCLVEWDEALPRWNELARRLERTACVRIESTDTDLTLEIAGRTAAVFAGEANWPDGEVATAPLESGVNGFITFPEPFYFASQRIRGLRLDFNEGLMTNVTAAEGGEVAAALLETDEGSKRIGELGIGLNAAMKTLTGDLLFDEKILGTIHIAMGRAYPQCGGKNESSLHWDIVKDLRKQSLGGPGSISLDGETILADGEALWL